jgi:uncharacterized membrane protein YgcG
LVVQLLLLLTQQLQHAPAHMRAAFLHSPHSAAVLCVLSDIITEDSTEADIVTAALQMSSLVGSCIQLQDRNAWRRAGICRWELVELVVLPGLLLQPVHQGWACTEQTGKTTGSGRGAFSGSTSSGGGGGSGGTSTGRLQLGEGSSSKGVDCSSPLCATSPKYAARGVNAGGLYLNTSGGAFRARGVL